jgi:hypothetical protein
MSEWQIFSIWARRLGFETFREKFVSTTHFKPYGKSSNRAAKVLEIFKFQQSNRSCKVGRKRLFAVANAHPKSPTIFVKLSAYKIW